MVCKTFLAANSPTFWKSCREEKGENRNSRAVSLFLSLETTEQVENVSHRDVT